MSDLKNIVEENFKRYAGNVILDRAICDVRDMLKPSARMLMHSQVAITKNIPSKPFVKSARVVGDCLGHYYTHGDSSCYGTYMRMAKPFAMRYPLEDCQGNSGTINATGDEAASRYTELRLSPLGYLLFDGIEKETIKEWADNFDETEQYPKILCSKGFYNIVNGTTGIGVSLSSSIPQFNLKDINNAMIELINNKDYEIDIMPDFATGGILLNRDEVKESLKKGNGAACRVRSVIEYDAKEHCFIVKELPYGVYCDTISEQIRKLIEEKPDCGVEYINNGSGKTVDYHIYINKKANPNKVLKLLYKETSLQSYFSINMTVLINGKYPKVMGLKDLLLAHIDHEKIVYRRGFEHDLNKMKFRVHIIDGLLICIARIEDVIQTIKSSSSTAEASAHLQKEYLLDADQAKAVLDLKLSRLAHLEVTKLNGEKNDLLEKIGAIEQILNNEELFNNELIKGWREVASKFGDARRTKILNISKEDEEEPTEVRNLILNFTNKGGIYVTESSSLYTQRRGGVGSKFKMEKGEYIVGTETGDNTDIVLLFSDKGNFFQIKMNEFPVNEKTYITQFITMTATESICNAAVYAKNENKNIYFITKNGLLKKTLLSEYYLKRGNSARAINLDSDDEIVSVFFGNDNLDCGILSSDGNFIMFKTDDIKPIGRIARGVKAIKLNDGAFVQDARMIPKNTKSIISVTKKGLTKQTNINEFSYTNKNTKGSKIQGLTTEDGVVSFEALGAETEIIVTSTTSQIRVAIAEIPMLSRSAQGVHVIKLKPLEQVIQIEKI